MANESRNKISILVLIFVGWTIVQTVRAFVAGVEPYPAIYYPGFGSNGKKPVLEYELYKKEDSIYSPISYKQSVLGHSRFRTLLRQIVKSRESNDDAAYEEWSLGLLGTKKLEKGDTIKIIKIKWKVKKHEYREDSSETFIMIL